MLPPMDLTYAQLTLDQAHRDVAAALAELTGLDVVPVFSGFQLLDEQSFAVTIVQMLTCWQLTLTPRRQPGASPRVMCFEGTGWRTLLDVAYSVAEYNDRRRRADYAEAPQMAGARA